MFPEQENNIFDCIFMLSKHMNGDLTYLEINLLDWLVQSQFQLLGLSS